MGALKTTSAAVNSAACEGLEPRTRLVLQAWHHVHKKCIVFDDFYGLNVSHPRQIPMLKPNPHCDGILKMGSLGDDSL